MAENFPPRTRCILLLCQCHVMAGQAASHIKQHNISWIKTSSLSTHAVCRPLNGFIFVFPMRRRHFELAGWQRRARVASSLFLIFLQPSPTLRFAHKNISLFQNWIMSGSAALSYIARSAVSNKTQIRFLLIKSFHHPNVIALSDTWIVYDKVHRLMW